jgi:hypothetical protein
MGSVSKEGASTRSSLPVSSTILLCSNACLYG